MSTNTEGENGHRLVLRLLSLVFVLGFSVISALGADVAALFKQAQSSAVQLKRDTEQMEAFGKSNLSWQSHAQQINSIKNHINKGGQTLSQLKDARSGATHWQQDAIDRITPLLQELASNTEAVINHLNEHRGNTWSPEYTTYLTDNYAAASALSAAITDCIQYGDARGKTADLEQKLGFGTS